MDVDPLADTVPPRHTIESDDEDEYNPLHTPQQQATAADIQLIGFQPASALLIANGNVAKTWARGANLGEQIGAVMVNKIQVGLLFRPSWLQAAVLVSEVTTRLPLWAMRPYARAILNSIQPAKLVLLDEYASPAYISDVRIRPVDAPLRYLSTDALSIEDVQPFASPNLIQSASAAFVAHQAERFLPATVFLVPAPYIAPPAPRTLAASNFARLQDDSIPWDHQLLQRAHKLLGKALGGDEIPSWTAPPPEKPSAARVRPETEAEFSM
ncbi:hypothetical protein C8F01DRAFT_1036518, partial [Mycena amicta]